MKGEFVLMHLKPIGTVLEINRYPVKSFAGETLNSVKLEPYGLLGDRSHAFVDDTKEGWSRYITARQYPEMLRYKAELITPLSKLDFPQVKITCPDGRTHQWDEQLLRDIPFFSDQKLSMERYRLTSQEQLAVDDGSILIITDQSIQKLEQIWGKRIDNRRFRANFMLGLFDEALYDESSFVGKQLTIGNAQLSIKSLCERCSMITIDPDTQQRESSLLKKIHETMDLNFGVYADVEQVGMVHVGDQVYISIEDE